MQVDLQYIRRHYAALSDDALLALDRADLLEAAQQVYDEEIKKRGLAARRSFAKASQRQETVDELSDEEPEFEAGLPETGDEPAWLEESAQVYSIVDRPGVHAGAMAQNAHSILEAAGIPCYLERIEMQEEKNIGPRPTHEWRLLVPGDLNLQAASTLDRDIFNVDFEAEWRNHLEAFSDRELLEMKPEVVFCGLFDRVARAIRTYNEELSRRGLDHTPDRQDH